MWYFAGDGKKAHAKEGLQLRPATEDSKWAEISSSLWDWYGAMDIQTSEKCDRLLGGMPADPEELGKKIAILRFVERPSALGLGVSIFSVEHQSVHYLGIIKDGKSGFAAILPIQRARIPAQAIRRILSPSLIG